MNRLFIHQVIKEVNPPNLILTGEIPSGMKKRIAKVNYSNI